MGGAAVKARIRIFRWTARAWRLNGTVVGNDLSPTRWIQPASLTKSPAPDFAIEGCGAGDTNCLSVISRVGGHWHALWFEYGWGRTHEVNGLPAGHKVEILVDACSCAGGPSTWTYERYYNGEFRPVNPPGATPDCSASSLESTAYMWQVQVLHFDHVACAAGWALAVGTGTGFSGTVVALFDRVYHKSQWQLMTLDNGLALPAAPSVYDVPLPLLLQLGREAGSPVLAPQMAAARLIARLQVTRHFYWPQQEGLVAAAGALWLIAVVPTGKAANNYSPSPVGAVIYLWNGSQWVEEGRIAHLPKAMNIDWYGGWFVSVPTRDTSSVAFAAGPDSGKPPKTVITNAGGKWHVGVLR
jgi:hypothetical protein